MTKKARIPRRPLKAVIKQVEKKKPKIVPLTPGTKPKIVPLTPGTKPKIVPLTIGDEIMNIPKIKKAKPTMANQDLKKTTKTTESYEMDTKGNIVKKTTTVEEFVTEDETPAINKTKTQVIFVLDKSSSMATGMNLTISGFNRQLEVLRNNKYRDMDIEVSLVTFNETVDIPIRHSELGSVQQLTTYNYSPYGNTALYDGIGAAISLAKEKSYYRNSKNAVLIAIFTDGEENASRNYTQTKLRERILRQLGHGNFTFTVVGPRNSLYLMEQLGINKDNIAGFTPESIVSRTWVNDLMGAHTVNYMSSRVRGESFSGDNYASATASVGADPSLTKNADADKDWPFDAKIGAVSWPFPKADNKNGN